MLVQKKTYRELFKKYLSEILVIVVGISISFWFEEWRSNRKDRETEKKHLINFRNDLIQDTLQLTARMEGWEILSQNTYKLASFKRDSEISDSIDFYIDNAASYVDFKSNQTAYEEIKQTGQTNLVQNDSLKRLILRHYTIILPYINEWCNVNKTHTMTQVIPEMSNYFPVVIDAANTVSTEQKIKSLKTQKLRNLLLTNAAFKRETLRIFEMMKQASKGLIKEIDKELKKKF